MVYVDADDNVLPEEVTGFSHSKSIRPVSNVVRLQLC